MRLLEHLRHPITSFRTAPFPLIMGGFGADLLAADFADVADLSVRTKVLLGSVVFLSA